MKSWLPTLEDRDALQDYLNECRDNNVCHFSGMKTASATYRTANKLRDRGAICCTMRMVRSSKMRDSPLRKGHAMNFDNVDIPPELEEEAKACETPEEMLALAKRKGYKLSDADLAAVSGGWGVKNALPQCPSCHSYEVSMSTIFASPGATRCACSKCGYTWTRTPFG